MREGCRCAALILAAGEGTRMKSDLAKVLHPVGGKTMIRWVLQAVRAVSPVRVIIVIGHQADDVRRELEGEPVEYVLQEQRLGTGHAALLAEGRFAGFTGTIVVLNGDTPLLRSATLERFIAYHRRSGASATVLSAEIDDPAGYGRIVRDERGGFLRITEHKDASRNVQGEYYITDVMEILRCEGKRVGVYLCDQRDEVLGINTVEQLRAAERLMSADG
jgi:bifunctional N-acetylglucosamine-1-phosphate-uridyltransferase/glucosamine-1-phosphate-acetyltransferase GlmU-like protein